MTLFRETGIKISLEGRPYLGSPLGTFAEGFVQEKVREWVKEVKELAAIATTHPHAAYAAFTHGFTG